MTPKLYHTEPEGERSVAVIYAPDDDVLCYVVPRIGQPREDALHRAEIIAQE